MVNFSGYLGERHYRQFFPVILGGVTIANFSGYLGGRHYRQFFSGILGRHYRDFVSRYLGGVTIAKLVFSKDRTLANFSSRVQTIFSPLDYVILWPLRK